MPSHRRCHRPKHLQDPDDDWLRKTLWSASGRITSVASAGVLLLCRLSKSAPRRKRFSFFTTSQLPRVPATEAGSHLFQPFAIATQAGYPYNTRPVPYDHTPKTADPVTLACPCRNGEWRGACRAFLS